MLPFKCGYVSVIVDEEIVQVSLLAWTTLFLEVLD